MELDVVKYYTTQLTEVLKLDRDQKDLVLHMFLAIEQQGICKGLDIAMAEHAKIKHHFSEEKESKHEYSREAEDPRRIYDKPG